MFPLRGIVVGGRTLGLLRSCLGSGTLLCRSPRGFFPEGNIGVGVQ